MKIAAIYDLHGNFRALEAVLQEIEKENVDKVIVGGDVAWGPQPKQVVDHLFAKKDDYIFVMGNSDREIYEQYKSPRLAVDTMVEEVNQWCIEQLTDEQLEWLGSFKSSHVEEDVLFVHGSPRSDSEAIRIDTPAKEVEQMISNTKQSIIVCGHTHIQFKRQIASKSVINAGSVGLQSRATGACWLCIDTTEYDLRMTEYDVDHVAKEILRGNAPYKEDFAEHVTNPPYQGP
ncbi:hypothetical protein DH09_13115 [Bacillaceae bacterium JMAK1]|nr:hypothetical protein DH09_13115 [Bacillaceae bacterium JMAK1]